MYPYNVIRSIGKAEIFAALDRFIKYPLFGCIGGYGTKRSPVHQSRKYTICDTRLQQVQVKQRLSESLKERLAKKRVLAPEEVEELDIGIEAGKMMTLDDFLGRLFADWDATQLPQVTIGIEEQERSAGIERLEVLIGRHISDRLQDRLQMGTSVPFRWWFNLLEDRINSFNRAFTMGESHQATKLRMDVMISRFLADAHDDWVVARCLEVFNRKVCSFGSIPELALFSNMAVLFHYRNCQLRVGYADAETSFPQPRTHPGRQ